MTAGFDTAYHAPVMVTEVVDLLRNAKSVLDGTLGGGGHSAALLDAGVPSVTGVDRDPDAIASARARLERQERAGTFRAVLGNYADLDDVASLRDAHVDGALLDLGISSHQIDADERGFSFREGAPLDMRMSSEGPTARDLLNSAEADELSRVFREYADEPRAARLAREIVRRRSNAAFGTSDDLVRAIRGAFGPRTGPAITRKALTATADEVARNPRARSAKLRAWRKHAG